jgi:hypothetical protein
MPTEAGYATNAATGGVATISLKAQFLCEKQKIGDTP